MIKKNTATRLQLIHELSVGICKVVFQKISNKEIRTIYCTLKQDIIPGRYQKTLIDILKGQKNPDLLSVYDIKEQDWKSFHISSLEQFFTVDDLSKSKKIT